MATAMKVRDSREPDEARYNVAVVGQTGVGKSSLVKYLYPDAPVETGVGKPVTGRGFHEYRFELKEGLPVTLFDSWGLEVGKQDEWMRQLEQELEQRGVSVSAQKWFHSVFYCIAASGTRVQDCDVGIIRKFIENKYPVCVVLTKSDLLSEDDESELVKAIKDQVKVEVISVCNVSKKTRGGVSQQFGKNALEKRAFLDFFRSLIDRLPLRCEKVMSLYVDKKINSLYSNIDSGVGWGAFNEPEFRAKMGQECDDVYRRIPELAQKEFDETVTLYGRFLRGLEYPPITQNLPARTFNFKKPETKLGVGPGVLLALTFPILVPAALVYQFGWGKDEDIKKIRQELSACEKSIRGVIKSIANDIVATLEKAQLQAEHLVAD